jgi:hypothetical protein
MRTMLQATNLPRLQSCEEIVLGRSMACNSIFETRQFWRSDIWQPCTTRR